MSASAEAEDRILRLWTPLILRLVLLAAVVVLLTGLVLVAAKDPAAYVAHFRRAQQLPVVVDREPWSALLDRALHGKPHDVLTLGLMLLTLVPLVRVAFCFLLFLKTRDWPFVLFTAYVLTGLVFGTVLGRIG